MFPQLKYRINLRFFSHKQEKITDSEDSCSRFRGVFERGEETGEDTETGVPSTVDSIVFLAGLESVAFPLTAATIKIKERKG